MGNYEFTLAGGQKVYDGIAAANSAITVSDNNNENRPELKYVWFQGVSSDSNTYTKLNSNPVNAGQYFVVLEYEATNRYRAYKGYTETEEPGVYTLDSTAGKVATYIITQRPITITIENQTSAYGDDIVIPHPYQITDGTVVTGDNLGLTITTTATSSSNVGTYPITGTRENYNYDVRFVNGTYTITKKAITITALAQSAAYTGSEPAVDQSMYKVVDNEQNPVTLLGNVSVVITKDDGVNVGEYTLTPSFNNGNYEVTFVNGTFTITANALTQEQVDALIEEFAKFYAWGPEQNTVITIENHAGSYTKTYDAKDVFIFTLLQNNPQLSGTVYYKLNDGSFAEVLASSANQFYAYKDKNARVDSVVIRFNPNTGYAFKQGVNADYTITLTVNKAPLTITASAEVEYDDFEPIIWVNQGNGWVSGEDYETYDEELEMNLEDYVGSNYTRGQNAGTPYTISWNGDAEAYVESVLTNYDVTLAVAQNLTVAKKVVDASDYAFAGYTGVYDGAEHALAVGSAEDINANFDIVNIAITSKSSVKDVADTGAYTATITLADPTNYTFENGDNEGWNVANGYASAAKTAQVTITAATLTINVDYTKTTATFTLTDFVGNDTVADLTNLAYLADGANINGNVYTINGYVANAITVSATSDNKNYTITDKVLKNIVKVEYKAGQYDAEKAGMTPVLPETEVFFAGFTAEQPQAVALNHYTFVRFATDANNTAAFDFAQAIEENKVVYAIWNENEKYTLTLYYMVEGDAEHINEVDVLEFYSDESINYNNLPSLAQKSWFKVEKWFTLDEQENRTEFIDGAKLSEDTTLYANYKFNIGIGDVNADGNVNANDITLYREWIVGGYEIIVVEKGNEWTLVNSEEFNSENVYFVKRVADSNAATAEATILGDENLDIRDVSTIRMGLVGGYGFSIMEGKFVDGEELIVIRRIVTNNASDLLIVAKSGVAAQLAGDITEENFVGVIENCSKDVVIDLNGHTLTVKSLNISLAANNTGKIEIKNGSINVADGNGVHLSAPAGSIVLDNVTLYDRDGEFELQAADHSLHLYNEVKFLKYNAQNENEPLPAEVKIENGTHVVLEKDATLEVAYIQVVSKNDAPEAAISIKVETAQATPIAVIGNVEITGETTEANIVNYVCYVMNGQEKVYYSTLQEAVNAANGETIIYLNGNINGNGVIVQSNQNITFDFNGYTYIVDKNTVGSAGTETNGFQLLKDSTVTFKNGTLKTTTAKILIQNYANTTLDNFTVSGQGATQLQYVASNNFGSLTVKDGSKILAYGNQVAFDLWYGMSSVYDAGVTVTLKAGSEVQGKVEYGAQRQIAGWTDKTKLIVEDGAVWDEVITLSSNIKLTKTWVINYDCTIDMAGKTISNDVDLWNSATYDWSLVSIRGCKVTITGNGHMLAKENDCFALDVCDDGELTINNGTYRGNISAIYAYEGKVIINGGDFDITQLSSQGDYRFLLNCLDGNYQDRSNFTVYGGTFNEFNPENNLSEGLNTNYLADKHYVEENNGVYTVKEYTTVSTVAEIAAVRTQGGYYQLGADIVYSGQLSFTADTTIDLNGYKLQSVDKTALSAANGAKLTIKGNGNVEAQEVCVLVLDGSEVEINGGTYTSHDNFVVGTNGSTGRGNNTITINAGTFNGNIQTAGYVACGIYVANNDIVVVNGGTFNITNGAGIVARAGNTTVGANVVFNMLGDSVDSGKVGDSRIVIPCGAELVVDLAANYPGYNQETFAFTNYTNYQVTTIEA